VPAGLARVRADRGLLRQALTRLLDNAVRAARSEIRVEARQEGEADGAVLSVTVVDDGEGMDAKELSRAIDPFFTTRPSGIGLGLSIVDRVARHHGGALELESAKGEGTRVRVEVPAVPLEAPP
jgi:signal transduction histidine kinase